MVLAQRHSHPHSHMDGLQQAIAQIQPARILGIAGAIALNAAALMLLLVPVSAPMQVAPPERIVIVNMPKARPETPPPPVLKIEKVQPPTQTPQPQRQVIPQPEINPPPVLFNDSNTMSIPVPEITTPDPGPPRPVGPQISESLQYASAPAPAYPHRAMMDNREGTVVLKVLVDVDGTPLSVEVQTSSGHRELDEAARKQVLRKWKFRPAIHNGQAIQVYGIVPVRFSLDRQ